MQGEAVADMGSVNAVLQQFPQFHETCGIKEGDGMWHTPEDRILVW